jgi:hypothetical protein
LGVGAEAEGVSIEAQSTIYLDWVLGNGCYQLTDCRAGEMGEVKRVEFDGSGCEVLESEKRG